MSYYTYIHLRESDNKPFYIGKGQEQRAWSHKGRNPYWKNIVAKHGLKIEILAQWDSEHEAFEHEKFLISCFRDMGHRLVNMTDGGEGTSGFIRTEESNKKLSITKTGTKRPPLSSDWKNNIGKTVSGRIWINNGLKDKRIKEKDQIPTGYVIGRFAGRPSSEKVSARVSGSFWVNNGDKTKMIPKNVPIPDGFVLGRIKKAKP